MRRLIKLSGACMLLGASISVQAAIINYQESVSGDVAGVPTFTVDTIGTHSISGNLALTDFFNLSTFEDEGTFDTDDFLLNVLPGFSISDVRFSASQFSATSGYIAFEAVMGFRASGNINGNILQNGIVDFISGLPDTTPIAGNPPYVSDIYYLALGRGSACSNCTSVTNSAAWDWTVEFDVNNAAVVPVPAAVWLFGSGLIGLIGIARKKAA